MTAINRWVLMCQNRVANIWYNQDYTVFGLNPTPGGQAADNSNIVTLHDLGNGTVALQCGAPAFASVRDDYGYQVQFQAPYSASWITSVGGDEILQVIPTGDGYFALRSATFGGFVAINPAPDGKAGNCNALVASGSIGQAARFTAIGLDRNSIFDFLQVGKNASGMSFAGVNLANVDLSGKNNLSGCDFRDAASLSGCNLEGATLQRAQFAGLRLGGLNLSGADCTEADFTRSDFTSFTPGMPPPILNGAMLAGAVVPAGASWAGAKMAGAVLAEANLTGCDLSGPPAGLTDANISGQGVTLLDNAGIGGYDLASSADRVFAYDYDGSGQLDHLVCYRPGSGALFIVKKNADGTFTAVYSQGDPGAGIGGYNLTASADRVFAYDYDGSGKLDHLACYRPGTGTIWILKKVSNNNSPNAFTPVCQSGSGIGGYDLTDLADRVFAYDYDGSGKLDHLVCYRPGSGALFIVKKNADGTFTAVYSQGDPGAGIGGYNLTDPADRVIAYDYDGSGKLDHLACYRPGTGTIWILKKVSNNNSPNAFTPVCQSGSGIGGYDLTDPADRVIAYDYDGSGMLDHLACYRPGGDTIWILQKVSDDNSPDAFTPVYRQGGTGIGGYNLTSSADQLFAYDYDGSGKLDHLACYRPGTGTIWILKKVSNDNSPDAFTPVYSQGDPGSGTATDLTDANFSGQGVTLLDPVYNQSGIGGYDLTDPADRVIACDYDSSGKLDHLVCYRPGRGALFIVKKNADGTFTPVYSQGDPGAGIGGYSLADPADRVFAYDYDGSGKLDHLVCYRPGTGTIWILKKVSNNNSPDAFSPVYYQAGGIGGYNLASPADRIFAYDYDSSGQLDYLACYRPGTGTIWILKKVSNNNSPDAFTPVYSQGDPGSGIGGYDLANAMDQVIAYDYDGSGKLDHLACYRPGTGTIWILKKVSNNNSPNAFTPVCQSGSGIGGYDLASSADRVIAYDFDGSGKLDHLACYRPGGGMIWILKKVSNNNSPDAFTPVYNQPGTLDLRSPADLIIAYDYEGSGQPDHLVCYRPGTGLVRIMQKRTAGAATLAQCNLRQANLTHANLVGLDLTTTASLAGANLSSTQLPGTKLAGADLTGVILVGTDFTGTDLTKARFSSPLNQSTDPGNPTIFAGCTLPCAVIGLDWSCLDLTTTIITGLPTDPTGAVNLAGLVAQGMRRPNGDFGGFILDGANFAHATLDGAQFTGASLRAKGDLTVNFAGAKLTNAYFTQAALEQADFSGAVLGGLEKEESAHFSFAFLSNCNFDQANLFGVHFPGATLVENRFTDVADIQQADFSNAYLPNADFTQATLRGATFDGAFMVECILSGADLTPAQGALATSLVAAFLQGATWQSIKLGGADLTKAVITNARGAITEQHYDDQGKLTQPFPIRYPASGFPALDGSTICPNGYTHADNQENRLTIDQEMARGNPPPPLPAQWKPPTLLPAAQLRRQTGPQGKQKGKGSAAGDPKGR